MHIFLITKKISEYIYRRRLNFLLTAVVMIITFYMLFVVLEMMFESNYYIYDTKKTLSGENFVNINILMDEYKCDYHECVETFIDSLTDQYKNQFGKFMYLTANYNVNGEEKSEDTLYVDTNMFHFCELNIKEDCQDYTDISDDTYIKGYVCRDRLEEYPVGTILENRNTTSKTMIVGYFESGSRWISDPLLHTQDSTITLDSYIVSAMDEKYFQISELFYSNVFNSLYIMVDSSAEIPDIINGVRQIADESGVKCYCHTLEELIAQEKKENRELAKNITVLVAFAVFVAMAGVLSACLADVFSRHYDIAVMSVNGVSPMDIYGMLLLENCIKVVLSFFLSSFVYQKKIDGTEHIIFIKMVVPVVVIGAFLYVVFVTTISFKTIKQGRILTMIGGERL